MGTIGRRGSLIGREANVGTRVFVYVCGRHIRYEDAVLSVYADKFFSTVGIMIE